MYKINNIINIRNYKRQWTTCAIAKHHGSLVTKQNFTSWRFVIFRTRKDQNKSKFKEKIQH